MKRVVVAQLLHIAELSDKIWSGPVIKARVLSILEKQEILKSSFEMTRAGTGGL